MVQVILPTILKGLFPGCVLRVEIEAATVAEVMDKLNERWPGMKDRLCDSTPRIRRHINVFVEGEKATLETSVPRHGEVVILTAISGG
jgi:molybdopterin synthase sulfur carrier subunit